MRKLFILMCLIGGMISCAEPFTPVEEPITFKINIQQTKSVDDSWVKGDKVFVFFNGIGGKYVTVEYDGTRWSTTPSDVFVMGDFPASGGTSLAAVYFPVPVDISYADNKFSFTRGGEKVYSYYLLAKDTAQIEGGTELSTTLQMGRRADFVGIYVKDLQTGLDDLGFTCPLVKPVACASVGIDGTIAEDVLRDGDRITGIPIGNGALFTGALSQTGEHEAYNFRLTGSEKIYTFNRLGVTLTPGQIYECPALSEAWSVSDASDYPLLSAATSADIGKVVCDSGHLHPAKTAVPDGCTPVGVLVKVDKPGHGLIMSLYDAPDLFTMNYISKWTEVNMAGSSLRIMPESYIRDRLKSYTALGSTPVSNWGVAGREDYEQIFSALGSTRKGRTINALLPDNNVNAYFTQDVGGEVFSRRYWTTTRGSILPGIALMFSPDDWAPDETRFSFYLRPVMAFSTSESRVPAGAINGMFKVSDDKIVFFSKGNLQYDGTWHFAEYQWETYGSVQYDDHRDLFGWGTKDNPNQVTSADPDYKWAEWGDAEITNGAAGYRTLTRNEWDYLITHLQRDRKVGAATVNGVRGIVLLNDWWESPEGIIFIPMVSTPDWNLNRYSMEQWARMEANGAVFLPCAGSRDMTHVAGVGEDFFYWSSNPAPIFNPDSRWASALSFERRNAVSGWRMNPYYKHMGFSVRLVRDFE